MDNTDRATSGRAYGQGFGQARLLIRPEQKARHRARGQEDWKGRIDDAFRGEILRMDRREGLTDLDPLDDFGNPEVGQSHRDQFLIRT